MRWWLLAVALLSLPARADERWDRFQVLLWQDRTEAQLGGLAALGFTGAKLRATNGVVDLEARARRVRLRLPYYLENLATDFYAPYHRYVPGRVETWLFDEAKAQFKRDPADASVFVREPSLSDPAWAERIRSRLESIVRDEAGRRPLFFNLADEAGIGDLAAAWDFDQSPVSLAAFRTWLHGQYADLASLNREWGTDFAEWDAIVPELTTAAIGRGDENFAAWSDFKAWMDVGFARAVRAGTEAVHAADPAALAALEGGQVPGWGGYDYALLAPAVDVMEIYDFGESMDLATAFNPTLIPFRTSFATGPREVHAAWRHVLHGGRGMVVWDEADDVVGANGMPGPRGLGIGAFVRAVAPVAAVLLAARPAPDAVAMLQSQASFRVQWLLDRRAGDRDWASRDAEREYDDNPWRMSRRVMAGRLAQIGVQPQYVSSAMLEAGALVNGALSVRVLLLPHAIALSDAEVSAIRAFRAGGGTVLADTEPGVFDGHGRRREALPLPEMPHPQAVRPDASGESPSMLHALSTLLQNAGAPPRVSLLGPDRQVATGVEVRWFQHQRGLVMSLQAMRPWGAAARLSVRLPGKAKVTDLRSGAIQADVDRLDVTLDGVEPTVLLLSGP